MLGCYRTFFNFGVFHEENKLYRLLAKLVTNNSISPLCNSATNIYIIGSFIFWLIAKLDKSGCL